MSNTSNQTNQSNKLVSFVKFALMTTAGVGSYLLYKWYNKTDNNEKKYDKEFVERKKLNKTIKVNKDGQTECIVDNCKTCKTTTELQKQLGNDNLNNNKKENVDGVENETHPAVLIALNDFNGSNNPDETL